MIKHEASKNASSHIHTSSYKNKHTSAHMKPKSPGREIVRACCHWSELDPLPGKESGWTKQYHTHTVYMYKDIYI